MCQKILQDAKTSEKFHSAEKIHRAQKGSILIGKFIKQKEDILVKFKDFQEFHRARRTPRKNFRKKSRIVPKNLHRAL